MPTREEKIAFIQSRMSEQPVRSEAPATTREEKIAFIQAKQAEAAQPSQSEEQSFNWKSPISSGLMWSAKKGVENIKAAGDFLDKYDGAPPRAFVGALQDGKNPFTAMKNQIGEDASKAPTSEQMLEKAGVPETVKRTYGPNIPGAEEYENEVDVPVRKILGTAGDMALNFSNALPAVGPLKRAIEGTEAGGKAIRAIGTAATKTGELASKGMKEVGKRAISIGLGPDMSAINRYLDRADEVRNAKSVEEIKDSIDQTMSSLFDNVETAKMSKEEARETLRQVESKIRDTVRDSNFQFRVNQADLKQSFNEARTNLDRAYEGEKAKLASNKSPIELKDDVATAIQDVKQKVVQGSEESYAILDQDTRPYSVRKAGPVLRKMADEMNIQPYGGNPTASTSKDLVSKPNWGTAKAQPSGPVTTQTIGVQNELRKFAALLEQTPEAVPASEIKKILQQIDASEMAAYGQPGFDSRVSQAYKMIRATIDEAIKANNQAYREKMFEVSGNKRLMESAIKRFGDERATVSRLDSIGKRTADADRQLLNELGIATGRDFESPVQKYISSQDTLKNPQAMEQIKGGLPEFQKTAEVEKQVLQSSRPEASKQFVRESLETEGLPKYQAAAKERLAQAEQELGSATTKLDPFKRLTPENTQGKIKALIKAPGKENIEIRRTLEDLSKASEKDFVGWINDRRAADQFSGEFRVGSRNVGLWGIIGSLTGGPIGTGFGVALGATVDRFGPKMAQKILDGALKVKGLPTIPKIQALKLDPKVEHYLIRELSRSASAGEELRKVSGPDDEPKLKGREKWANDGLDKIYQHTDDTAFIKKLQDNREAMMRDPKLKDLLIKASDLKPGSKAMDAINLQIKERVGQQ